MPVYNAERFLREAIESILGQTFTNFEFLIINDGSSDGSKSIIEEYHDPRIRLVENERNLKLSATLNKGIEIARGEYIARMDNDDISLPNRLQRQVEFLDQNSDIAICGTWYTVVGDAAHTHHRLPVKHRDLQCYALFHCPFAHPSVMFRKSVFDSRKFRFDQEYSPAEDYHLWTELLRQEQGANIPEFLFLYRSHSRQMTKSLTYISSAEKLEIGYRIFRELLAALGITPTKRELQVHFLVGNSDFEYDHDFLLEVRHWLEKLSEANRRVQLYNGESFSTLLTEIWFRACNEMTFLGIRVLTGYRKAPPQLLGPIPFLRRAVFIAKSIVAWDRFGLHERVNTLIAALRKRGVGTP